MFDQLRAWSNALKISIHEYFVMMLGEERGKTRQQSTPPSFYNQQTSPFPNKLLYHICLTFGIISIAIVLGFMVVIFATQVGLF